MAISLADNLQEDGYDCYIVPENKYYGVCHGRFNTYEEAKEARDKAAGQVSLFAGLEDESFSNVQYQLVGSSEEYTDKKP